MKFLVLGGGAQGSSAAYDLLQRGEVEKVVIADRDVSGVRPFLEPYRGGKLELRQVDAGSQADMQAAMEGMTGVLCGLPYYFNEDATRAALEAGAHFTDLGGNTEIVEGQKAMAGRAEEQGVSVVPDTGLAPGLVNVLAQAGIDELDHTDSVRMWVGGLPQEPKPPLNYNLVYSLEGVLDYYTTDSVVLEDGEPHSVEALTGLETLTFQDPLGELEAFHTAGGISTMPYRYRGKVREMAYKTLRYPGHASLMKGVRDLGLLDEEPVAVDGATITPKQFFIDRVEPRIRDPEARDVVVLRVEARGEREGEPRTIQYELLDFFDEDTGMTAMMRVTGFSMAVTSLLQARGETPRGVHTPDEAIAPPRFVEELGARGVRVSRSELAAG